MNSASQIRFRYCNVCGGALFSHGIVVSYTDQLCPGQWPNGCSNYNNQQIPNSLQQGWICPQCNKTNAPFIQSCNCKKQEPK